jgi:hypothetical protein
MTKRRITLGLLGALAVWPLCHRALVARYDVSPWALFGWAMFCTPKITVGLAVAGRSGGQLVDLGDRLSPSLLAEARRFVERRRAYGTLVAPRRLVDRLLASDPALDAVVITTSHYDLDPKSSRLTLRRITFTGYRDGTVESR